MELHSLNRTLLRKELDSDLVLAHFQPVDVLLAPDGSLQGAVGDVSMDYVEFDEEVYPMGQL